MAHSGGCILAIIRCLRSAWATPIGSRGPYLRLSRSHSNRWLLPLRFFDRAGGQRYIDHRSLPIRDGHAFAACAMGRGCALMAPGLSVPASDERDENLAAKVRRSVDGQGAEHQCILDPATLYA